MKTKKNHINRAHYLVEIITRLIDRLHKIKKNSISSTKAIYSDKATTETSK